MAKFVLKDASLTVNSVDLSDHVSALTVETTADEVDLTAMGATYREFGQGLQDATITATFYQDFAAAKVDATLWPLVSAGSTFTVVAKPTSSATSATNPSYTMVSRMFGFNPLGGAVGDASSTDVTFRNATQTGLVRGTT